MKSEDTSLFMLSLLMRSVEELVDQGVEILEELIAWHQHQGGIVLVATHVPINLSDALARRLPLRHLNSDRTLQQIMFQQKQKINYIGILHIDDGKK
jgi:phosphoserine phosphatase